jgi:hypothetical protein
MLRAVHFAAMMNLRFRTSIVFTFICLALALVGCTERTKTRRIIETFAVVPGTPSAESKTPQVQTDPTMATTNIGVNVQRQCDVFRQVSVRKVDILWVIDSSGSMAAKQARLAASFQQFINQLVNANPPIDFHIAVTTTDTDNALLRGKLRPWTVGANSEDYISCVPEMAGVVCNTGANVASAVSAFQQMSQVGITGSAHERGLFAAYLALNNPVNNSTAAVDRFIRKDASLYVIAVSDEDDGSCNPMSRQATCTADPGCRCAPDNALAAAGTWGSTEYFIRYFETFKGFGNGELVTFSALVGSGPDAGVPAQFGDPNPHVGCCRTVGDSGVACPSSGTNDGGFEIGYHASRYLKVASETGGLAVSICQDDFTSGLSSIGYSASGLRTDFRLSRGPDSRAMQGKLISMSSYISAPNAANCMVSGNCPSGQECRGGRCAVAAQINESAGVGGSSYVKCDVSGLRNMVRFEGTSVPVPLSTIEICYDVLASFQTSCQ